MQDSNRIRQVVGLDVSDRWTQICVISRATGEIEEQGRLRTTPEDLRERFAGVTRQSIALEVGPHSAWMSRQLKGFGHEVLVANASKVALIYRHSRKCDRVDAESLARLARLDPRLLHPLRHRSASAQADLSILKSRQLLVEARTKCLNHVRGVVKAMGHRLPRCTADSFANKVDGQIPELLTDAIGPVVEIIASLTRKIRDYEKRIDQLAADKYPETQLLRQVQGVGPITSLAYVLVIEDKDRFAKSRSVGPFLGLVPRMDSSGNSNPQLRITKEGDQLLRRLLVHCAHYILGPHGPDCDLRRYGERIAGRGGKIVKSKAVVAVARKLAVLLHRLWTTGEVYDPFFHAKRQGNQAAWPLAGALQ